MGLFRLRGMAVVVAVAAMTICISVMTISALSHAADAHTSQYGVGLRLLERSNANVSLDGQPVRFNLTVSNTRGPTSEVLLNLTSKPQGWQHELKLVTRSGTFTSNASIKAVLLSRENASLRVTIVPTANSTNGTYWTTLSARVTADATANDSTELAVMVGRFTGFEFRVWNEPPEGYFAAIPPSQITIRFGLVNTGSVTDRFLVRYSCNMADAGWTLRPVWGINESGWTQDVPPDPGGVDPYFIDFQLPIPAEEKGEVRAWIVVNATSSLDQPERVRSADTTVRSLQYFDFQAYINGEDRKAGAPGEQVEFQVRIWNRGNGYDVFTISPHWDEELNPGFIATVNPPSLNISSNETANFFYIVRIPEDAPEKIYFFTVDIRSSSGELAIVEKSFEVEVTQSYKVELSCTDPRQATIPGGILDYEVYVRNAGNGLDFMSIHILGVPPGWLTYIQPPEVGLLQGERSKVVIRVIVPSRFEEAPQGLYNLTVKADSSRSAAEAQLILQLDLAAFYRIEWMFQDQPITDPLAPIAMRGIITPRRAFNPYEKDNIDITLEIKNLGNANDDIRVWGVGADARVDVTVTPERTLLLSDQTRLIKVHIVVQRDLPPDTYVVYVNASSQDLTAPARVVPLDFEVYNIDAGISGVPTCHDMDRGWALASVTTLHDECVFWLDVANLGGRPLSSVGVRAYDSFLQDGRWVVREFFSYNITGIQVDRTYYFGHFGGSGTDPAILWWANVTGRHKIEFRVFCESQSNLTNDVAYIDVTVVEAPPPAPASLPPLFLMASLVLFLMAIAIAAALFTRRRGARGPGPSREPRVDPAAFERALPPFKPEPDRVALMPRATREQVALYGQDLDGEEVDQVIEKETDLSEDEVGP